MNEALQKTLTLLLLIGLGLLLRAKFKNKEYVNGIKQIVLTVALPATIFIALLKIELNAKMIFVPLAALAFNFIMFAFMPLILKGMGIERKSATGRTLTMLVPSLAPGLSCFPFIAEFLGEQGLALAALADVGNKFFVLIFLYIVAMNMFLSNNTSEQSNLGAKVKSLLMSLISEPINMVLFAALILLGLGINYTSLPVFIQGIFDKTSATMTPLVLIFIGLAVQLKEGKKRLVISVLFTRAGLTLLFSALLITLFQITEPTMILLTVVLPLSSVSFWPFAHISVFNLQEEEKKVAEDKRTFDAKLAVLVLAFSLPFSTLLILSILTAGNYFTHVNTLAFTGLAMTAVGIIPRLLYSKVILPSLNKAVNADA
jgi:predicted permease